MADADAVHGRAFFLEDLDLAASNFERSPVVRADRAAGALERARGGAQHQLGLGGDAFGVVGDLDCAGFDLRFADADFDFAGEDIGDLVGRFAVEPAGDVAPEAGRADDVEAGGLGDFGHQLDIALEVGGAEFDQRVDAAGFGFAQLADGALADRLAVDQPRVVIGHHGGLHRDMLVAEREAELVGVDRAEDGFDGGHGVRLRLRRR